MDPVCKAFGTFIGLSKERPILGDHPKAHIHEIQWISCGFHVKSGRFHVKSTYKTYKSNISRKTLQFYGVLWEGYVMFSHEIRQISKDQQLPGMVRPMFSWFTFKGQNCVQMIENGSITI